MKTPKPSRTELRILEVLWNRGTSSIREIQESFPEKSRPAYTTVQTLVYRLEVKKALRRIRKSGSANLFEPVISRSLAQRNFIDEFLGLFGGQMQPVMTQLIEAGNLSPKDVADAEKLLRELSARKKKDA